VANNSQNPKPRKKPDFYGTENVPRMADKSWRLQAPPMFEFVFEKDRTIDEILEWGKARGLTGARIRHTLAWLSVENQVHYDTSGKIWRLGPEPRI